jgi:3D (Asp-Asp-Asp) domain-containing protein
VEVKCARIFIGTRSVEVNFLGLHRHSGQVNNCFSIYSTTATKNDQKNNENIFKTIGISAPVIVIYTLLIILFITNGYIRDTSTHV